jgi:D-sedoheptulose 7-phosphate isomerase
MSFTQDFLKKTALVAETLDVTSIEKMATLLAEVRERGGRVFFVGSGGGAGHASHAVCDFRKLGGMQAICPTDNVSELTARINDEGWETSIAESLKCSGLCEKDAVFVFSVGGGSEEKNISANLVNTVRAAKSVGAAVLGVVGRDGGFTAAHADACAIVPTVDPALVTPLTEAYQAVVWHLLVSHPLIQKSGAKWETTK